MPINATVTNSGMIPQQEKLIIFPHHIWLLFSDYRGMAKWFGTHYSQEVRFSSVVKRWNYHIGQHFIVRLGWALSLTALKKAETSYYNLIY